jgi:hypothetical protein
MTPSAVLGRYGDPGVFEVVTDTYKDDDGKYKPMNLLRARAVNAMEQNEEEDDAPPSSALARLFVARAKASQEENGEEDLSDGGTAKVAKWTIFSMVRTVGGFAVRTLATIGAWTLRMARSLIWTVGRFVLRSIVVPVLEGLAAILTTPVGLGVTAILGGAAVGYFLYRSFFKGDDPHSVDKGGSLEKSNTDEDTSFWSNIFGSSRSDNAYNESLGSSSAYGVGATADRVASTYVEGSASDEEISKGADTVNRYRSSSVAAAIKEASRVTGMSEAVLTAIAYRESAFNPRAGASTSSAKGLFQFIKGTWAYMVKTYGARFGVPQDADIFDPLSNAIMGAVFLKYEVYPSISAVKPNPNATDLYIGHFMGAQGGAQWLKMLSSDPGRYAYLDWPDAAAANRSVYWNSKTGKPRTYAEIYNMFNSGLRGIEGAMSKDTSSTKVNPVQSMPESRPELLPSTETVKPEAVALGTAGQQQSGGGGQQASTPNYIKYKGMAVAVH